MRSLAAPDAEGAVKAAEGLGYPVALKLVAPDLQAGQLPAGQRRHGNAELARAAGEEVALGQRRRGDRATDSAAVDPRTNLANGPAVVRVAKTDGTALNMALANLAASVETWDSSGLPLLSSAALSLAQAGPAAAQTSEPLKTIRIGIATGGVGSNPVRHGVIGLTVVGAATPQTPQHPVALAAHIKAPVLGLYGGADTGIPLDTLDKMKAELAKGTAAGKASEFVVYPEVPHAFHADYRPSYRQAAAVDGWQRLLAWLKRQGVA